MPKYRKKPVEIEAVQWNGDFDELKKFAGTAVQMVEMASGGQMPVLETLESNSEVGTRHAVSDGDYVIKGVKGEFYACKPDIFEMTYEQVND